MRYTTGLFCTPKIKSMGTQWFGNLENTLTIYSNLDQ